MKLKVNVYLKNNILIWLFSLSKFILHKHNGIKITKTYESI